MYALVIKIIWLPDHKLQITDWWEYYNKKCLIFISCSLSSRAPVYFFLWVMFVSEEFSITTTRSLEIINITDEVEKFLDKHHCKNWFVNVFARHTTATIKVNEFEDGFIKDLKIRCDTYIPEDAFYHHNDLPNRDPKTMYTDREESLDGHSHLRHLVVWASSETIPVQNGKMLLWVWQSILFIEMDHGKDRKVVMSFVGE